MQKKEKTRLAASFNKGAIGVLGFEERLSGSKDEKKKLKSSVPRE